MNVSHIKAIAQLGSEQVGRRRLGCTMLSAAFDVILKHCARRCVHRHKAGLSELRAADRQHSGIEIDVRKPEVAGFAETQPGNAQQSEQAIICPWPELTAGISARHLDSGGQEALDVFL